MNMLEGVSMLTSISGYTMTLRPLDPCTMNPYSVIYTFRIKLDFTSYLVLEILLNIFLIYRTFYPLDPDPNGARLGPKPDPDPF